MGFGPLPGAPDSSVVLVDGPWTHRTVRANGIALHVAEVGTGPLVLLLHGFPQFWWTWHQQLVDLADAGFRAVAVDLRGYGASDKPPRGSLWVRALFDRWTGPRWRGTPGYVADVERYAQAMRIHPVSFCAAEHYRWTVRSLFRADGRRFAQAVRTPITAP